MNEFEIAADLIDLVKGFSIHKELLIELTRTMDVEINCSQPIAKTPNVRKIIDELRSLIVWEGSQGDIPTPREGVDEQYDKNKGDLQKIADELELYLQSIRAKFGNSPDIIFAHTRHRYEIEFPSEVFALT